VNQYIVIRGDTPTLDLELVYADGTVPDLAGATISFIVDGLFTRTDPTVDLSSGEASLELAVEDTENAPNIRATYRYNVQVETDGLVLTVNRGLFIVVPDVPA
jgi:hypothetical protein